MCRVAHTENSGHEEKWSFCVCVCVCVFVLCFLVWAIKKNLKSVIMVVGKAGREGALILQVDGDFFPLVQLPLGEHHAPDPEVSSAFKLEASSLMAL